MTKKNFDSYSQHCLFHMTRRVFKYLYIFSQYLSLYMANKHTIDKQQDKSFFTKFNCHLVFHYTNNHQAFRLQGVPYKIRFDKYPIWIFKKYCSRLGNINNSSVIFYKTVLIVTMIKVQYFTKYNEITQLHFNLFLRNIYCRRIMYYANLTRL